MQAHAGRSSRVLSTPTPRLRISCAIGSSGSSGRAGAGQGPDVLVAVHTCTRSVWSSHQTMFRSPESKTSRSRSPTRSRWPGIPAGRDPALDGVDQRQPVVALLELVLARGQRALEFCALAAARQGGGGLARQRGQQVAVDTVEAAQPAFDVGVEIAEQLALHHQRRDQAGALVARRGVLGPMAQAGLCGCGGPRPARARWRRAGRWRPRPAAAGRRRRAGRPRCRAPAAPVGPPAAGPLRRPARPAARRRRPARSVAARPRPGARTGRAASGPRAAGASTGGGTGTQPWGMCLPRAAAGCAGGAPRRAV